MEHPTICHTHGDCLLWFEKIIVFKRNKRPQTETLLSVLNDCSNVTLKWCWFVW